MYRELSTVTCLVACFQSYPRVERKLERETGFKIVTKLRTWVRKVGHLHIHIHSPDCIIHRLVFVPSSRHDRDRESARRVVIQKENDLIKAQAVEKRQLPKYIRQERKVREMMFRESLKISAASGFPTDPDREKQKMKQFLDTENRRYKDEQERCERKHRRQLEELHRAADNAMTELENLQSEKKRLLTEHENLKV